MMTAIIDDFFSMESLSKEPKKYEHVFRTSFRLAHMNEEHTIIEFFDGKEFNTLEEAIAYSKTDEFTKWNKNFRSTNNWIVTKHDSSEVQVAVIPPIS